MNNYLDNFKLNGKVCLVVGGLGLIGRPLPNLSDSLRGRLSAPGGGIHKYIYIYIAVSRLFQHGQETTPPPARSGGIYSLFGILHMCCFIHESRPWCVARLTYR